MAVLIARLRRHRSHSCFVDVTNAVEPVALGAHVCHSQRRILPKSLLDVEVPIRYERCLNVVVHSENGAGIVEAVHGVVGAANPAGREVTENGSTRLPVRPECGDRWISTGNAWE